MADRVTDTEHGSGDTIAAAGGDVEISAELLADKLGLSPEALRREMRRGIVYGTVERGEGPDAGQVRLTVRYRARCWSITLQESELDRAS